MLQQIEIEKNVPLPKRHADNFDAMEVGDSFAVKVPEGKEISEVQRALAGLAKAYRTRKNSKRLFKTAQEVENNQVRIWRIK